MSAGDDWDLNAVVRSSKNHHQMNTNNNHHHRENTNNLSPVNPQTTPQTKNDNHSPTTHERNNNHHHHLNAPQYVLRRPPPQYIYQNTPIPAVPTNTVNNIIVPPNITNNIIHNNMIPNNNNYNNNNNNNNVSPFLNFGGFSGQQQPQRQQYGLQNGVVPRGNPVLVPRPAPLGYSPTEHNLRAVRHSNMQIPPKGKAPKKKDLVQKTIHLVTKENLNSDPWCWRKYGRKPIKGSRYPRNYYRCSSSKACSARKQMERSGKEPNVYVLTFTGEHCHPVPTQRNPLAGTTRSPAEDDVADTATSSYSAPTPPSTQDSPDFDFDLFDDFFFDHLYYS